MNLAVLEYGQAASELIAKRMTDYPLTTDCARLKSYIRKSGVIYPIFAHLLGTVTLDIGLHSCTHLTGL
jgi:hypothetical protein